MSLINRTRFAGRWYRDDPELLQRDLQEYRAVAELAAKHSDEPVSMAILPHAGLSFSGRGIAHAFMTPSIRQVTSVLILSPSHYRALAPDTLVGESFSSHATPLGEVAGNESFSRHLVDQTDVSVRIENTVIEGEHGTEMFLPFIRYWIGDVPVSMLLVPEFSSRDVLERWADTVASVLSRDHANLPFIIGSSDFSHYGPRFGYTPFGLPRRDADAVCSVRSDDLGVAHMIARNDRAGLMARMSQPITVCGRYPILLALAIRERLAKKGSTGMQNGRVADYYSSLDITGRRDDEFVCYASIIW